MSRREKTKHLQTVCIASGFQRNPMSDAKLVKDWTPPDMSRPRWPCSKTTSWSSVWAKHGLEFRGRDVHPSFIFIEQRTQDVETRWASDSWHTLADHHESQRPPLGEFLPETHIEVCVVEVREAHDEFSQLLNRGALLCRICQLVCPHLRLRQLLELCSAATSTALNQTSYGKTGEAAFGRRRCTSLKCLSATTRRGLSTALSLSCKCGRSQE